MKNNNHVQKHKQYTRNSTVSTVPVEKRNENAWNFIIHVQKHKGHI